MNNLVWCCNKIWLLILSHRGKPKTGTNRTLTLTSLGHNASTAVKIFDALHAHRQANLCLRAFRHEKF